ncbi:MAG: amino acid adenylation domain-containing protein [Myxococcota bacterium]
MSKAPNSPSTRDVLARSLVQIKQLRAQLDELQKAQHEPIAIVGIGCRLPGGVDDPDTLRAQLREGFDAVGEIPAERWDLSQYFDADVEAPGKMYTRRGAFLGEDEIEGFDAGLFGISPREATSMDPQQRLLLEVTHEALERAGLDVAGLEGSDTGVFAGVSTVDYGIRQFQVRPLENFDPYFLSGNLSSFVAGRVAYTFGFQGPALSVDTACSSSLVAVHLAVAALRRRETSLAVAGGVNVMLTPEWNVVLSRARMMAPDGRCKTFDAAADGYVRGEGCGVVVLKRLADALRDGDPVEAVIRGSAINQDGPASGITVPNGLAQQQVIRAALADGGLEPNAVGYIEAHGTGTSLGDPIEVRSLAAVYGHERAADDPLRLGSIKTNMGHLESAAGVAGLIKAVLSVNHGEFYPHLHLRSVNPEIDLGAIPAQIPTTSGEWTATAGQPRRAGVSSFGASGTNAHLVIEQPPTPAERADDQTTPEVLGQPDGARLFVLSAKTADARDALASRYAQALSGQDSEGWADLCATAQRGRSALTHRLALVADGPAAALQMLEAYAEGRPAPRLSTGRASGGPPRIAMLFAGQGSQSLGMGQQLREHYPVFREAFDRCEEILRPMLARPLLEVITGAHGEALIDQTAFTQPAIFAVEYALYALWRSWGVRPSAVLGHSVGEYVAATVAGVFDLETGLRLIATRGKMMQELTGDGGMVSLKADEARVRALIEPFAAEVSIAAINGPSSVVVSGLRPAIDEVRRAAEADGLKVRALTVSHAFHSPQMEPMLDAFAAEVARHTLSAPKIPLASNLEGALADERIQQADYWRRHVREPVRFADGLRAIAATGIETFVELGGHPVLTSMARAVLPEQAPVLPSLRRGRPESSQMLESLGGLFVRGLAPRWEQVTAAPKQRVRLPSYPYQRRHYWVSELEAPAGSIPRPVAGASASVARPPAHPLLDARVSTPLAAAQFQTRLDRGRHAYLADFVIEDVNVINIGVYLEMTRAAVAELLPDAEHISLDELSIEKACVFDEAGVEIHVILTAEGPKAHRVAIHSVRPDGTWIEHCNGRVVTGPEVSLRLEPPHEPASRSGDQMYAAMEARGIGLGPAARWIEQISSDGTRATATLRAATPADGGQGCGVFDALFQSAFEVLPEDAGDEAAFMLVGASHIRMHAGESPTTVLVTRRNWDPRGRSITIDVCATDPQGAIVLEVEGAMLKHASRDLIRAQLQSTASAAAPAVPQGTVPPARLALRSAAAEQRDAVVRTHLLDGIAAVLGSEAAEIDPQISLLELGLDSLMAVDLKRVVEQSFGVPVPLVDLLEGPSVEQLGARLLPALTDEGSEAVTPDAVLVTSEPAIPSIEPDPERRYEPFALTDLQQAYLIGRGSDFSLGNVSTYFFIEVELWGVDLSRLEEAWNKIVARHDMLRAVFSDDGTQRVLPEVPRYAIARQDLRELAESPQQAALRAAADEVKGQVFDTAKWPMFEIRASQIDERTTRLHLGFDALIMDAWSTSMLFGEWADAYAGRELRSVSLRFADYMRAVDQLRRSEAYARDVAYWEHRIDGLPPAPELPLCRDPESLEKPAFTHRTVRMPAESWARLQQFARKAKVTPSVAICGAYAQILSTWSRSRHFSLNLLFFNRLPLHEQVKDVVANFSSTTLLEIDMRGADDFTTRVQRVQRQLAEDLDHGLVTGVEVLRRINRRRGGTRSATMPVVFASTINLRSQDKGDAAFGLTSKLVGMGEGGREIDSSIRTPQVWLDHQVLEENGELIVNWDVVEALFPEGMIDAMFESYQALLMRLADDPSAWTEVLTRAPLPPAQLSARRARNQTAVSIRPRPLHESFVAQAQAHPESPAVITESSTMDYGELDRRSEQLAHALRDRGLRPAELVAVVMHKGWEQVVAVLAIHKAGGAYLPIDPAMPTERVHHLVQHAGARLAITQPAVDEALDWPADLPRLRIEPADEAPAVDPQARLPVITDPNTLAYVIYTSGSTGLPKGVAVTHAAAWNTIADINHRFEVGAEDRMFGISSLSFDLSVYDVFGPLSVGGALVIPQGAQARDPAAWAALVRTHGVTIWNSVPALMQMLTEQVTGASEDLGRLRVAMLSGDWIPVPLPDAIRAVGPDIRVVSLGGATEAAIWSIHYPIGEVPSTWASIPYGRPLANQRFHVLDDDLEPRPVWVPGELYIAGDGLAMGYWNDPERSAASFFHHPRTGERLYRTGDMGRYRPDGDIEFLGREDNQVKVQGYRIELGEIEAALDRIEGLARGVASVQGERAGSKTLVGYLVPADGVTLDVETVRARLQELIPPYMIPTTFVVLESLPLTSNGKVNRKALPSPQAQSQSQSQERVEPRDEREQALAEIWCEVLSVDQVGVTDDFFALGGQSFLAMRMMARIHGRFGVRLPMSSLLEHGTIEGLARRLSESEAGTPWSPVVEIQAGSGQPLVLAHPVGGNVLCYTELARGLGMGPVLGLQAQGVEPGASPLTSIEAMAQTYLEALAARGIEGPLSLGGWSLGGVVAYEMARQLEAAGTPPARVVMIDSRLEPEPEAADEWARLDAFMLDLARTGGHTWTRRGQPLDAEGRPDLSPDLAAILADARQHRIVPEDLALDAFERLWQVHRAGLDALAAYQPGKVAAPVHEIIAAEEAGRPVRSTWAELVTGSHTQRTLPGDHYSLLLPPNREALVQAVAALLS